MLQPKRTKFRKAHKGRIKGNAKGGTSLNFGSYGLKSLDAERVRMGKGKGSVEFWACKVKPGRIMFEIDGVSDEVAREALRLGAAKLPVRTKVVTRPGE